jgi:type IV pilus assembly protein PilC
LFLNLLEMGMKQGRTPEQIVCGAATTRDRALGIRFYLLSAYLEKGLRLGEGLAKVPRLLPPRVVEMLRAGEKMGDLLKVMPACQQTLQDGVSQVRGALNYPLLVVFAITPVTMFLPILIQVKVLPKFEEIFQDMIPGGRFPAFSVFVFSGGGWLLGLLVGVIGLLWALVFFYLGGPRTIGWFERVFPGLPSLVAWRLPWRRKRLQRDFSTMLALLLDANVPEAEAVNLAANATANRVVTRRSDEVRASLRQGIPLHQAVGALDDQGEFRWRLTNARHGGGFLRALEGWHRALDARAFQLEQTAAQLTTTGMVLLNGFVVACIVIAVFLVLLQLLNGALLW